MVCGQRVLVVDPSADSRQVLRTVLERRGVAVFEAASAAVGAELARWCHPDLVVFDGEMDPDVLDNGIQALPAAPELGVPTVFLGRMHSGSADDRLLTKPYHYAALIRTIEEVLGTVSLSGRRVA